MIHSFYGEQARRQAKECLFENVCRWIKITMWEEASYAPLTSFEGTLEHKGQEFVVIEFTEDQTGKVMQTRPIRMTKNVAHIEIEVEWDPSVIAQAIVPFKDFKDWYGAELQAQMGKDIALFGLARKVNGKLDSHLENVIGKVDQNEKFGIHVVKRNPYYQKGSFMNDFEWLHVDSETALKNFKRHDFCVKGSFCLMLDNRENKDGEA
jgi:hypothetical protein